MKPHQLILIKKLIVRLQKAIDAGLTYAVIEDNKIKVVYPNDHIQDLAPYKSKEKLRLPPSRGGENLDEPVHSQDHWRDDFMDEGVITKGQIMRMINEDTNDYGYLHPAIVSELYNTLADNGVYLAPENGETYAGRHFYIRKNDNRSSIDITINYRTGGDPTVSVYSFGSDGFTQKGLSLQEGIDLILSHKDELMDFNESVEAHQNMNGSAQTNLHEDDSQMAMLQQATEEFNQMAEEDLTPDEFQDVVCSNPDTMQLPSNIGNEEKKKVEEFKAKLKTASVDELKQVKRQLKDLRKQAKQQQNEQASMVTLLGVTMPQGFALVIGGILLIMVLNILLKIFNIHLVKTVTSWCTGRQSTSYGIRFGRN